MVKRKLAACSKENGKFSMKRKQAACSNEDGKCGKEDSSIDQISMLPDDLLVFILSHLTFKEATGTSILSRRWRYLWTFTRRLDFDGTKSLLKFRSKFDTLALDFRRGNAIVALLDEERSNYVKWVNHVVALRKDSPFEVFKVNFFLSKAYEGCIDEWVKYALARKVETLELNLSHQCCPYTDEEFYSFPYRILRMEQEICSIHFKQLKKLSLASVNVNGETLEFFLCNCPLLEDLSVSESRELLTLRIVGPFPSLKRLELCWCINLDLVEIRDVNLVCLKFTGGGDVEFLLHNAPMLVDVCVEVSTWMCLDVFFKQFMSILPQLEILNIQIDEPGCPSALPVKMSNLKLLVVTHIPSYVYSLMPLIFLINEAPCLEKFVFEGRLSETSGGEMKTQIWNKFLYKELKEVMFLGYCGHSCEDELVMHFLKTGVAPALRKIVIDPMKIYRPPDKWLCEYPNFYIRRAIIARARANIVFADYVPEAEGLILEIL